MAAAVAAAAAVTTAVVVAVWQVERGMTGAGRRAALAVDLLDWVAGVMVAPLGLVVASLGEVVVVAAYSGMRWSCHIGPVDEPKATRSGYNFLTGRPRKRGCHTRS